MTPELQEKLENCTTLPSPPGVAQQIVELANDPEVDMDRVTSILSMDPAITTKILRIANSSMYAQQREMESLRQAIVVIGLNATMSLALSFSLVKSMQSGEEDSGLDYPFYWRRALLAATVSGPLAARVGLRAMEELFLASLIQDIGMLALDRTVPEVYKDIGVAQRRQDQLIEAEVARLGVDHAAVGGWLLKRWNFPNRLQQAVGASHDFDRIPRSAENGVFARCVAFTSLVAEVFLDRAADRRFEDLADKAARHLGIGTETLGELLEEVGQQIPDAEMVFETKILVGSHPDAILEQAKEALMLRSLQVLNTVDHLQSESDSLASRAKELEEKSRRDTLTGLYNRGALDERLDAAFKRAAAEGAPLSVAFADLDKFKEVNDTYGHQAGDQILKATARILEDSVRSSDIVARYGGEEFIVVFPDTGRDVVEMVCERIVKALRESRHDIGTDEPLAVTISIGMATNDDDTPFEDVKAFVKAADEALYRAKLEGRDRSVAHLALVA